MTTTDHKTAAKKTSVAWQGMSFHKRAKPGTKGTGNYYRIIVRPKEEFMSFRTQDVGEPGGLQRLAGRRSTGIWGTQAWLVSKDAAHVEGRHLIGDNKDVRDLIRQLGSQPVLEKGDIFRAKDTSKAIKKEKPRKQS